MQSDNDDFQFNMGWDLAASDIEHILRTRITVSGTLPAGSRRKTWYLPWLCGWARLARRGHAIEFDGPGIEALSVEARMAVCNLAADILKGRDPPSD